MVGTEPVAPLDPLVRDLVEWVALEPKPYSEVMEAWRTSCPRLTIWEDAIELGLLRRQHRPGRGDIVEVTERGRQRLRESNATRALS